MKYLLLLLLAGLLSISFGYGQSCFSSKDDVMTYVIWKSFSSNDGNIKIEFGSSQATLRAGGSTYNYKYDNFSYLGSGYKGAVTMTELNGGGGLKMYVSCREKTMTDGKGTVLFEGSTGSQNTKKELTADEVRQQEFDNRINQEKNKRDKNLEVMKEKAKTLIKDGKIVKVAYMEVFMEELTKLDGGHAEAICQTIGDGWKLPTKEDLTVLWKLKDSISDLTFAFDATNTYYVMEGDKKSKLNSDQFEYTSNGYNNVRLVRYSEEKLRELADDEKEAQNIIALEREAKIEKAKERLKQGPIYRIDNMEVMPLIDLGFVNWDDANSICKSLGDRWRLPNRRELYKIYETRDSIGFVTDTVTIMGVAPGHVGFWSSHNPIEGKAVRIKYTKGFSTEYSFEKDFGFTCVLAVKLDERKEGEVFDEWNGYQYISYTIRDGVKMTTEKSKQLDKGEKIATEEKKTEEAESNNVKVVKSNDGVEVSRDKDGNFKVGNLLLYGIKRQGADNWNYAKLKQSVLGDGWRVPTLEQLILIIDHKEELESLGFEFRTSGVGIGCYWSSTSEHTLTKGKHAKTYSCEGKISHAHKKKESRNLMYVKIIE